MNTRSSSPCSDGSPAEPLGATDSGRHPRRRYWINATAQRRIMWHVVLVLAAGMGLGVFNVLLAEHFMSLMGDPSRESVSVAAMSAVWGYLALWLGISITAMYLLLLVFSHRIAGPIVALRRAIEALGYGETRITLRRGDFLGELAEGLNATNQRLRERSIDVDAKVAALRAAASRLGDDELDVAIATLEAALRPTSSIAE